MRNSMLRTRAWRWDWNKTGVRIQNAEVRINTGFQLLAPVFWILNSVLMKRNKVRTYTISAVAEQYGLHQQTLRLYEREGLIKPSRSDGNTRLYTDSDLERLEVILSLTRDLGVNLAGVEIILNMREKMDAMQREFERFFAYLQAHAEEFTHFTDTPPAPESGALVPVRRTTAVVRRRTTSRS